MAMRRVFLALSLLLPALPAFAINNYNLAIVDDTIHH